MPFVCPHHRRRIVHFNVTANPTPEWTARQIAEAFPWESAQRYLLHDRDSIYGECFREAIRGFGMREVLAAPRLPWQSPCAERLIGSIRRECLDRVNGLVNRRSRVRVPPGHPFNNLQSQTRCKGNGPLNRCTVKSCTQGSNPCLSARPHRHPVADHPEQSRAQTQRIEAHTPERLISSAFDSRRRLVCL